MTTTRDRGATEGRTGLASALRVEVQLWLAVLFMAIAFGAGVIVHAMAAPQAPSPAVASVDGGGVTGGIFAPPLSDEQLNAGLPAGHPDVGSGSDPAPGRSGDAKDGDGGDTETRSGDGSP